MITLKTLKQKTNGTKTETRKERKSTNLPSAVTVSTI